jgi:hypothetical protein
MPAVDVRRYNLLTEETDLLRVTVEWFFLLPEASLEVGLSFPYERGTSEA